MVNKEETTPGLIEKMLKACEETAKDAGVKYFEYDENKLNFLKDGSKIEITIKSHDTKTRKYGSKPQNNPIPSRG